MKSNVLFLISFCSIISIAFTSELRAEIYDHFEGSEINPDLWYTDNNASGLLYQSGGFLIAEPPPYSSSGCIDSKIILYGDFEVILPWISSVVLEGCWHHFSLNISDAYNPNYINEAFIYIHHDLLPVEAPNPYVVIASCIIVDEQEVDEGHLSFLTSSVSGSFRITRVGSTINIFYDIGAGWVLLTTAPNAFTCPVTFSIYAQTGDVGWSYVRSDYISVEGIESSVKITKARMISSHELGVDLNVTIPGTDPQNGPWKVRFHAEINGKSFTTGDFDLSDLLDPGDTDREIRFDDGLDDRKIDLEYHEVPRFATNQKFELTAVFTGSSYEVEDTAEAKIPLPVIIIHGVTKNLFEDTFYFLPYVSLQEFLTDNGYDVDTSWYRTLYGPSVFHFSSQNDVADEVAGMLNDLIDEIVESTYADKVNIIGHSLGGLIGRYYAWRDSERIHKIIMIGAPNEGSSWFYIYAYSKSEKWVYKKLHTSDGQPNLRNWLPPTYQCLYDINNDKDIPNTFPNLFHQDGHDKPAPSGVTYYSIYSSQIEETPYKLYVRSIRRGEWYKYVKPPLSEEWGDGTVRVDSAITYAYNKEVPNGGGHGFLPANPDIQLEVLKALNDGE